MLRVTLYTTSKRHHQELYYYGISPRSILALFMVLLFDDFTNALRDATIVTRAREKAISYLLYIEPIRGYITRTNIGPY